MLPYQIKKNNNKRFCYRKKAFNRLIMQITHIVCMLDTLAKYENVWNKISASKGVMCVTLIKLPIKIVIVANIIYFYN